MVNARSVTAENKAFWAEKAKHEAFLDELRALSAYSKAKGGCKTKAKAIVAFTLSLFEATLTKVVKL